MASWSAASLIEIFTFLILDARCCVSLMWNEMRRDSTWYHCLSILLYLYFCVWMVVSHLKGDVVVVWKKEDDAVLRWIYDRVSSQIVMEKKAGCNVSSLSSSSSSSVNKRWICSRFLFRMDVFAMSERVNSHYTLNRKK